MSPEMSVLADESRSNSLVLETVAVVGRDGKGSDAHAMAALLCALRDIVVILWKKDLDVLLLKACDVQKLDNAALPNKEKKTSGHRSSRALGYV